MKLSLEQYFILFNMSPEEKLKALKYIDKSTFSSVMNIGSNYTFINNWWHLIINSKNPPEFLFLPKEDILTIINL